MTTPTGWRSAISAESRLSPHAARELHEQGFTIVPGPVPATGLDQYSVAYDRDAAVADPSDVSVRSSTRINDFVNRGPEFDGIYIFGPLLAACAAIIDRPFKLSGMRARTLESGAPVEALHIDVKHGAKDWPIVGGILMVDAFSADNGATRFVPGSHRWPADPMESLPNPKDPHENQVLACGPAGSLIIFNASTWHGHTENRSKTRRRSIQAHFVARDAQDFTDHGPRMRTETMQRIGSLARYVLDVDSR
jgi:phytanoyl-CoA dioxygenase PhyH